MKLLLLLFLTYSMNNTQVNKEEIKTIVVGGGCFWCVEAVFDEVKGVKSVVSGYSGGVIKNPSYKEVSRSLTNHAEVCEITYNSLEIELQSILEIFYLSHDPTTLNRQGNDVGKHYRSIILYNDNKEKKIITNYTEKINNDLFDNKIVTEIKKLDTFYKAEEYHQDYFQNNSNQPYCKFVISPKVTKARKELSKYY